MVTLFCANDLVGGVGVLPGSIGNPSSSYSTSLISNSGSLAGVALGFVGSAFQKSSSLVVGVNEASA